MSDEIKMLPLPERRRSGEIASLARRMVEVARNINGGDIWPCVEVYACNAQSIGVLVRDQGMTTKTETQENGKVRIWVLKK